MIIVLTSITLIVFVILLMISVFLLVRELLNRIASLEKFIMLTSNEKVGLLVNVEKSPKVEDDVARVRKIYSNIINRGSVTAEELKKIEIGDLE